MVKLLAHVLVHWDGQPIAGIVATMETTMEDMRGVYGDILRLHLSAEEVIMNMKRDVINTVGLNTGHMTVTAKTSDGRLQCLEIYVERVTIYYSEDFPLSNIIPDNN